MTKYIWLTWFVFPVSFSAKAQNDTVLFSAKGGFYEEVLQLELFNYYPQNHIRYTTNGTRPTAKSQLYEEPLLLDTSKYSKSDIYTHHLLPAVLPRTHQERPRLCAADPPLPSA